jgi:hypothetical protein
MEFNSRRGLQYFNQWWVHVDRSLIKSKANTSAQKRDGGSGVFCFQCSQSGY